MDKLNNKVALITGSSRGIGAAIARLFAEQGAKVAVHCRDIKAAGAVVSEIEQAGGRAIAVVADVTNLAEIETMRHHIEAELGGVDILVANAGGSFSRPGALEETSEADWNAAINGNLTATFLTLKSFVPGMKERGSGNIITVSSAAARRPHPGAPIPYAVAKAGIQILTQDLAAQVGPHGIRVNCLAPETIMTESNQQRIPADTQKMLIATYPMRRLGTPEDVAYAALYLASDDAGWVSGIILDVAGGGTMLT